MSKTPTKLTQDHMDRLLHLMIYNVAYNLNNIALTLPRDKKILQAAVHSHTNKESHNPIIRQLFSELQETIKQLEVTGVTLTDPQEKHGCVTFTIMATPAAANDLERLVDTVIHRHGRNEDFDRLQSASHDIHDFNYQATNKDWEEALDKLHFAANQVFPTKIVKKTPDHVQQAIAQFHLALTSAEDALRNHMEHPFAASAESKYTKELREERESYRFESAQDMGAFSLDNKDPKATSKRDQWETKQKEQQRKWAEIEGDNEPGSVRHVRKPGMSLTK